MSTDHRLPKQAPRSLGQDAWRRLRGNYLAMASGFTLVAVVLFCVAGPWLSRHDPSQQRPWQGSLPIFSTVVDAWQENRLITGRPADVPPRAAQARVLKIEFAEAETVDYAVTLRRGEIHLLQEVHGARVLETIAPSGGSLHLLRDNNTLGPELGELQLRRGDALPEALAEAGRRFTLRHVVGSRSRHAVAQLRDQVVESLTLDGEATERLVLSGGSITSWQADGRSLQRFHVLGTDRLGRDLLVRIMHGGRISLMVGIVATLVSVAIGVAYGLISGYVGGRTDRSMMAVIDILYAIPFLFLVILLLVSFQRSLLMLFIALGAVQWLTMARIVRGQALSLRQREFIEAAEVTGASHLMIIWRHLLPNCMGTVIVYATLTVPLVILQESFLAFIGLQVELGDGRALDSWGALVQQGMSSLDTRGGDRWWLLVFPSLAMAITLLALNVLGDGLRDALDPRLRGSGKAGA